MLLLQASGMATVLIRDGTISPIVALCEVAMIAAACWSVTRIINEAAPVVLQDLTAAKAQDRDCPSANTTPSIPIGKSSPEALHGPTVRIIPTVLNRHGNICTLPCSIMCILVCCCHRSRHTNKSMRLV